MNSREIEQIEKKSIYSLKVCNELRDSIINSYLIELNKVIKSNLKKKKLVILIVEVSQ